MTKEALETTLRELYKSTFISKKQAAREIRVSTGTIDELRRRGLLKSRKVLGQVRFDISEISKFMTEA